MKLSQKRTCNGCKAFDFDMGRGECELRVKIDYKTLSPLEPCYKPKTIEEYFEAYHEVFKVKEFPIKDGILNN